MSSMKIVYSNWEMCLELNYQPMLRSFGEILVQVDDADYQGDSRLLYKKEEKFGYLCFGWGSCSGCDALQACKSIEEVQTLSDELQARIQWFDSAALALDWFVTHDWKKDYNHDEKFIIQCIMLLYNLILKEPKPVLQKEVKDIKYGEEEA